MMDQWEIKPHIRATLMTVIEASQSDQRPVSNILPIIAGLLLAACLYVVVTSTISGVSQREASGGRGNVVEARLGKGTEGLVKQTALHMSKLLGGEGIGGFPGFEPPDDDERYRKKIRNYSYTGEEANYWIKEINNFLRQIVKKNPGMTLEEILQETGMSAEDMTTYVDSVRNVLTIAESWENRGVTSATIKTLRSLMETFGVQPWS